MNIVPIVYPTHYPCKYYLNLKVNISLEENNVFYKIKQYYICCINITNIRLLILIYLLFHISKLS